MPLFTFLVATLSIISALDPLNDPRCTCARTTLAPTIAPTPSLPPSSTATPAPTPSRAFLYADSLTNLKNITQAFSVQYSYDKPKLDSAYISANSSGLLLSLYATDKAHANTSNTLARNELLYRTSLPEEVVYSLYLEQNIKAYVSTYQFAFMQLFGASGPNILIRWRNGRYQVVTRAGNLNAPAEFVPVLNQWVSWRADFKLSKDASGFLRLYRAGNLLINFTGTSSAGGSFRPKFGIYSQVIPTQQISIQYRNLSIARLG